MQTFYNGVTHVMRSMMDAVTGGRLMNKIEEVHNLLEEMALNNHQWCNERTPSKKVGGKSDF